MTEQQPTEQKTGLEGHEELQGLISFFREYGNSILIGLVIALAIILGFTMYKNHKSGTIERAAQMLYSSAGAPDQLQQLAAQYAETPAAPLALILAAAQYFDAAQYPQALSVYDTFLTTYPEHDMAPTALLGKAQVKEAMGDAATALQLYDAFSNEYADYYLVPFALFGKARALEQLGRYDEAIAVYEGYIEDNPESAWSQQAEMGLSFVKQTVRVQQANSGSAAD